MRSESEIGKARVIQESLADKSAVDRHMEPSYGDVGHDNDATKSRRGQSGDSLIRVLARLRPSVSPEFAGGPRAPHVE